MKKIISVLLILALVSPCFAVDISQLGLNMPNIQGVGLSEQTAARTALETALESPIDENNYRLGPGDTLAIHIIVGNNELNIDHSLPIGADGKVYFPNIGEIYLSGLNLAQAKEIIDIKIRSVYAERYNLFVLLSQPKKVKIYISGMVKNPGPLSVYDNLRVSEVIGQAGGIASGASNRYIFIKRKDGTGEEKILKADLFEAFRSRDLSKDIRIQAGDIIEVPDTNNDRISQLPEGDGNNKLLFEGKETFVYVYGEVMRSGRFEYVPGKKLSDYLSYAGGPSARALLGSVAVTRQVNGKAEKITINASDMLYNGNYRNDIEILGGDVINVPGNFFYVSDFTSFVNTVLLAVTLYATVKK